MELLAMMTTNLADPVGWSRARADEGYAGIGVEEHIALNGTTHPHLWVGISAIAAACPGMRVASTFANNLYRSPVEFAQAALSLHVLTGGRYDAGLGAGWAESECRAMGVEFPPARDRARRYREAVAIVRELFATGACRFDGEYYRVDQKGTGVATPTSPPLMVAVGGPWTVDHVAPLADRVELVPFAHVIRGGAMDMSRWREGPQNLATELILRARRANPEAKLSVGAFFAAGTGPAVDAIAQMFGDGPCRGLAGPAEQVAETLRGYGEFGVDRCSVIELVPGSYTALAEHFG